MKIIHSVASIGSIGGIGPVITNLQRELRAKGVDVEIVESKINSKIWPSAFRADLLSHVRFGRPDVIHDHGVWLPTNHCSVSTARDYNIPCIISTHGMLEPWAMQYNALKKRVAWRLYQHRDLQRASILHATTQMEFKNLRALNLQQPIAVIPLGVDPPSPQTSTLRRENKQRTVLFLSRIHPKKGLLNLVAAWAAIKPEGWRVVIAGPDENGHLAEIQNALRKYSIEKDFTYLGAVSGQAKWDLYRLADLFVLPTLSENFGLVVAEALGCGIPVITTKGAPWEQLLTEKCGWWIDLGVSPLQSAITEAIQLSDSDRHTMGLRGQQFVEREFSWSRFAQEMHSVYQWMLGLGKKPTCVFTT